MESPRRSRPRAGAAARGEEPTQEQWGWGELPPVGDPCWSSLPPDGWTPWYRPIWKQLLKSCCLWKAHTGLVWEGWHPMGGTPRGTGAESDHEGRNLVHCANGIDLTTNSIIFYPFSQGYSCNKIHRTVVSAVSDNIQKYNTETEFSY